MNLLFYNIFLSVYHAGIKIASLWNPKAKRWINGRRKIFDLVERSFYHISPTVWMHCASLGEFEQGRPVLESLRVLYPNYKFIITFFSPSGYEMRKNYKGAEHVFYLPMDSAGNAKKLVELINPTLVLWVKYEYWFYYLQELNQKNIPVLLISGVYRKEMQFFKWYGSLWKKMLTFFTHFFVQNSSSKDVLKTLVNKEKISTAGDTRFDRVKQLAEQFEPVNGIAEFCGNSKVIVAGSTWKDDEAEWVHYIKTHPEIKFIIAPHEIDRENLHDVKKEFPNSLFYSELITANLQPATDNSPFTTHNSQPVTHNPSLTTRNSQPNTLIIDNIGTLSRLYKYADITYVGGGFGYDGLHNILEAAVYGKPVIYGPEHEKNFEAVELIEIDGGICIENALELEKTLNKLFNNEMELKRRGDAAKNYVYANTGATEKIVSYIQENRLLTN